MMRDLGESFCGVLQNHLAAEERCIAAVRIALNSARSCERVHGTCRFYENRWSVTYLFVHGLATPAGRASGLIDGVVPRRAKSQKNKRFDVSQLSVREFERPNRLLKNQRFQECLFLDMKTRVSLVKLAHYPSTSRRPAFTREPMSAVQGAVGLPHTRTILRNSCAAKQAVGSPRSHDVQRFLCSDVHKKRSQPEPKNNERSVPEHKCTTGVFSLYDRRCALVLVRPRRGSVRALKAHQSTRSRALLRGAIPKQSAERYFCVFERPKHTEIHVWSIVADLLRACRSAE